MPLPSAGGTDCSSGLSARIFNNFRYDNPWQASQGGVVVGTLCCPTVPAGIGFRCTAITTGITGGSEPTWPTILTNMVVDGGVTWTAQDVANPSGKTHPPPGSFGYLFTANDLDGFRLLAYDTARAVTDELAGDNEAWLTVGGTGVAFANSWANFGGMPAAYFRDLTGRVYVRGQITTGALGTSAFTLPVGYRPSAAINFACSSSSAFGMVVVGTGGTVVPTTGTGGAGWTDFGSISFDTR